MSSIEYVPRADTIADISLQDATSGSLRTTTSILLSLLVILSFILNLLLISTILSSSKLRSVVLYLLFCNLAMLNIIDTLASMFISLLFVANGNWLFSEELCRFNAAVQQFVHMELLMGLMIMAVERAITLFFPHRPTFTLGHTIGILAALWTISICFAIPIFTSSIPVKPFKFRYLCAVDSNAPLLFPLAQILVYGGCLFISLVCFGALLSRGNQNKARSLPVKPQHYSEFIKKSRALQDYLILAKLALFLMIEFVLIEGPNIILNFFVEIRNSREILKYSTPYEVPQDADTILNWLKFIYPLIAPLTIYAVCNDIWLKIQQLVCCRRPKTIAVGRWSNEQGNNGGGLDASNVMTLIATSEGLHLRLPHHANVQQTSSSNAIDAINLKRVNPSNCSLYGFSDELTAAAPKSLANLSNRAANPFPVQVNDQKRKFRNNHPSKIPRIKDPAVAAISHSRSPKKTDPWKKKSYHNKETETKY